MPKKLFQIVISLIVIFNAFSCTTKVPEYIYVEPPKIELPEVYEYVSDNLVEKLNENPPVIMEPQTVNDLLENMAVYKSYYNGERQVREGLENYIHEIKKIIEGD